MKKKNIIKKIFLILLPFVSINVCGNKINNEYKKISNNVNDLVEYYDKKRNMELDNIFKELDIVYERFRDEEIYEYIKKYENYSSDIVNYYSNKITEKCQKDCSERLVKFYENLYDKTNDIEIFAMILEYKEYVDDSEYERIIKICLENNSIKAVQKQKEETNKTLKEKNSKIKKFNKEYKVIQNYEKKINFTSKKLKKVSVITDEENLYLLLDNDIQKIAEYYWAPELEFFDLNSDSNIEILVEYDRNIIIYIYEGNKLLKVFDAYKDISLGNYFKYELDTNNIKTVIKDDFGNEKLEIDRLPNEKEIINEVINDKDNVEKKMYYNFIIIKDKVIMNVMNKYFYQIIFDKSFNYKLKYVNRNEI